MILNMESLRCLVAALIGGLAVTLTTGAVIAQENAEAVDEQLSDRTIALAVENELLSSEAIDSHRVDADVSNGIVTLSGKVDNLLAKQRASRRAQQVKGVMAVINQIVVVPSEREDQAIAQDILHSWSEEPVAETFQLRVDVEFGTAKISGTADSYAERTLAEQIAAGVAGVSDIENKIDVKLRNDRSDQEILEEVQGLIDSAVELDDAEITVDVKDGQVVLNGDVGSAYAKAVAERKAWIAGVKDVDPRGIQVDFDRHDGTRRREKLQELTDEKIVAMVERALRHDPRLVSYLDSIDVESDAGSVTLTGRVGRVRAKEAAESVARSTVGVWRVKNNLKVRWAEEDPTALEIIDYVQVALKRDPYVSRHAIRVHCRNGHVTLYGLVDSQFEKEAAGWIAGGQKGVVHVNNNLSVTGQWEPKSDAEIRADIEEKLKYTFYDKSNDIDVNVENGVAILRGEVDTWRAWQIAMEKAIEAGARRPHNLLKVRYHPRHGGSSIYVPR